MRRGRPVSKGVAIDETAAWLVLVGALVWYEGSGGGLSRWGQEDWESLLRRLDPREAVVLVLCAVRGWTQEQVADWLEVSRGMVFDLLGRAKQKIAEQGAAR